MHSKNDEAPMAATIEASNLSVTSKELTKMSIATQISTINVPFHGDTLYLVNHNGEAFTPMKPIVDGMGLAWAPQHEKLKQRFGSTITEIVMVAGDGKNRGMTCLALRKLAGWLHTINVGKVRPELREKVARYQEECDDVLYQYWTKGEAKNPRKKTTVDERTPLRDAVNMLVGKKGLRYDDAYNMVHQRFAIDSIDELELSQIPLAVEYIHRVVLDGEYIGKQVELPEVSKQFSDDEIIMLSYMWLWMVKCQAVSKIIYPALKQIESRYAGIFYDIGNETRYITDTARQALIREAKGIDMNSFHAKRSAGMLAKLRGEKDDDLIH